SVSLWRRRAGRAGGSGTLRKFPSGRSIAGSHLPRNGGRHRSGGPQGPCQPLPARPSFHIPGRATDGRPVRSTGRSESIGRRDFMLEKYRPVLYGSAAVLLLGTAEAAHAERIDLFVFENEDNADVSGLDLWVDVTQIGSQAQ